MPARLGGEVAGRYVDARVFQWNNWWVGRALLSGRDLDYSDAIFYPSGVSLVPHMLVTSAGSLSSMGISSPLPSPKSIVETGATT